MSGRVWLVVDLAAKVALVGLLLFGALRQDLPQFAGKAMTARAITYPLAAVVVPAGWWLFARRRPFPVTIDLLIVSPFLIDTAGNALNLFDTVDWWDDANHLVNWAFLTGGVVLAVRSLRLGALNAAVLGIGFGAVTAILWEVMEYFTFIRGSPELKTAYTDTLGDLGMGLLGSVIGSTLAAVVDHLRRHPVPS